MNFLLERLLMLIKGKEDVKDLDYFIANHLPISETTYNLLISDEGLDGYKITGHENAQLIYPNGDFIVLGDSTEAIKDTLKKLKESKKSPIIPPTPDDDKRHLFGGGRKTRKATRRKATRRKATRRKATRRR